MDVLFIVFLVKGWVLWGGGEGYLLDARYFDNFTFTCKFLCGFLFIRVVSSNGFFVCLIW